MFAPNDFRFTSSNKEKVALLINRKQGENYHMRPVKTRHTGFSVIVTRVVRAREVYISRGLLSEAQRHNVRERNQLTDYDQIELSPFCCHCWGVGGRGRERKMYRECARQAQRHNQRVCVYVCVFERGVDRLLSRSRCHPTPSVSGSVCACVCVFEREASRQISIKIEVSPYSFGVGKCGCVGLWVCVGGAVTLTYLYAYKKQSW